MTDTRVVSRDDVFEGRSVEDATHRAAEAMGLTAGDMDVTVLERGSRGFLGLGARPARIQVQLRGRAVSAVRAMTGEILRLMGIDAAITARQEGSTVQVFLDAGPADGLLIGRKGETLQALQHVLDRMAQRQTLLGAQGSVVLDVAGYRSRRNEQLARTALELAERVRSTGRRAVTEPLGSPERRVVHRALEDVDVETHVAGKGAARRVVITPRRADSAKQS